jgi:hypothetical protein
MFLLPRSRWSLLAALASLAAPVAWGSDPIPQPASSAQERSQEQREESQPKAAATENEHVPSYAAPAVHETRVTAPRLLHEEERIGTYAQPRWSAKRRFPTTRIYVVPEGTAQFEWWLETKTPLDAADSSRFRSLFEFEFGLGHRLQLDLYLETQQEAFGEWGLSGEKFEVRYAFADWGQLWANPTLYVEWTRQHEGPHKAEVKLLLGDELSPRVHWGVNLVYERVLGGDRSAEYAVTGGVSYTLKDEQFSLGGEMKVELVDVTGRRFKFDAFEVLVGPSLQWRPVKAAHVDLVALVGTEFEREGPGSDFESAVILEPTFVFGWEF